MFVKQVGLLDFRLNLYNENPELLMQRLLPALHYILIKRCIIRTKLVRWTDSLCSSQFLESDGITNRGHF